MNRCALVEPCSCPKPFARPLKEEATEKLLRVDPGFVRKKFYERAEACGIAKHLGAPESLRKSRGVELMQGNLPLPAVQALLGHSTPNLTSSYVSFSEDDIQQVIGLFMEKESARKTSARNSFFGKIETIQQGDIQTQIVVLTMGGYPLTTVITNNRLRTLDLGKAFIYRTTAYYNNIKWLWVYKSLVNSPCYGK